MDDSKLYELTIYECIGNFLSQEDKTFNCVIEFGNKTFKTSSSKPNINERKVEWNDKFQLQNKKDHKGTISISLAQNSVITGKTEINPKESLGTKWLVLHNQKSDKPPTKVEIRIKLKQIDNEIKVQKKTTKIFEYFFVIKLKKTKENGVKEDSKPRRSVETIFRFPAEDLKDLPLDSLQDVFMFSLPSYFDYKSCWTAPIVFHFTVNLNETRVYGSTLLFYKKLEEKHQNKLYEPVSLIILAKLPFLDQFSATLKYIYMTFYHETAAKMSLCNCAPTKEMVGIVELLCSKIPAPNIHRIIRLVLKPINTEDYFVTLQRDFASQKYLSFLNSKSSSLSHPIVDLSQQSVRIDINASRNLLIPANPKSSQLHKLMANIDFSNRSKIGAKKAKDFFSNLKKGVQRVKEKRLVRSRSQNNLQKTPKSELDPNEKAKEIFEGNIPITHANAQQLNNNLMDVVVDFEMDYNFFSLPLISLNLYQNLFSIFDLHTVVKILSCIMCEISIVFISSQFSLLTKVQEGFKTLLFPFKWSHVYVPNLPKELLNVIEAPVPFMVGVNKKYEVLVRDYGLKNKAMFVHIDTSSIEFHSNIPYFPSLKRYKLVESLRGILKPELFEADSIFKHRHEKYSDKLQKELRKQFLDFMLYLLGDYGGFIVSQPNGRTVFDSAAYLESVGKNSVFFKIFLKTHMFSSFIRKHWEHPGLLVDYVEYICKDPAVKKEKRVIVINVPEDCGKIDSMDFRSTEMKGVVNKKDALQFKSQIEKSKRRNNNRISKFLKNVLLRDKDCSNCEIASISELLQLLEWRENFVEALVGWVKNPASKTDVIINEAEHLKILWLKNLNKIGLKRKCFEDLISIFHLILTECESSASSSDFRIAKTLLDVSTIFYDKTDGNKIENSEFIIKDLLSHDLLKNKDFWISVLVFEISVKFKNSKPDPKWCFQRILRYSHQMVDLNSLGISQIKECVEFWCRFCDLDKKTVDILKKAVKNLEASKNMRISEYLSSGDFGDFELKENSKSRKSSYTLRLSNSANN